MYKYLVIASVALPEQGSLMHVCSVSNRKPAQTVCLHVVFVCKSSTKCKSPRFPLGIKSINGETLSEQGSLMHVCSVSNRKPAQSVSLVFVCKFSTKRKSPRSLQLGTKSINGYIY